MNKEETGSFTQKIFIIFIVLIVIMPAAGYFYYSIQIKEIKSNKEKELIAITDSKVREIENWRQERLGDANFILKSKVLSESFRNILNRGNDTAAGEDFFNFMISFKKLYNKFILYKVFENNTFIKVATKGESDQEEYVKNYINDCLKEKKIIFTDFYKNERSGEISISILVPIVEQSRVAGILLMNMDPYEYIYPLIESWPTYSKSAESILIKTVNNELIILNELKNKKNSALTVKFKLDDNIDALFLKAGLGDEGIYQDNDYRNISVISCIRKIYDSPWRIIVKIDKDEIYSQAVYTGRVVAILSLLLIIGSGLLLYMFWSRQQALYLKNQTAAEMENIILEKNFDFFSKYANDVIILSDAEFNILDINNRAIELYGYTREEFLKMNVRRLFGTRMNKKMDQTEKKIFEKENFIFETMHSKKNGSSFFVEVSARIINAEGKIFIQEIIRDITERKKAEEVLKKDVNFIQWLLDFHEKSLNLGGEEFFKYMIEKAVLITESKIGFCHLVKDDGNNIVLTTWNNEALKTCSIDAKGTHYPIEKAGNWVDCVRMKKPVIYNDYKNSPNQKGLPEGHVQLRSFLSVPVMENDKVQLIFGVGNKPSDYNERDVINLQLIANELNLIMKKKKAEDELVSLNKDLENKVIERTSELQAINKELESFSYSVSHDLRAPLRAISGYTNLIKEKYDDKLDAEGLKFLDVIDSSSITMGNLIDDLLAFSRAGKQDIIFSTINMNKIVAEIIDDLKDQHKEMDIEFRFTNLPKCYADISMIKLVLHNLFSNALKFSSKKENAVIELNGFVEDKKTIYTIRDNGVGFDQNYNNKLFKVFHRLHKQEEYPGTGVGLALVKRIIERHHGSVWAEGKINEGAAFYFSLPVKEKKAD